MPSTLHELRRRLASTASGFKPPGVSIRFTNSSYPDPCGVGAKPNRFFDGTNGFPFYVGYDFETCVVEYFVRDLFDGKARRILALSGLQNTNAVILDQTRELTTVHLTKNILIEHGIKRTILAPNSHKSSRSFGARTATEQPHVEALHFESTNLSGNCLAVAKGAISAFTIRDILPVARIPNLVDILRQLNIDIDPTI